jgi:hypothetical protein
VCPISARQTTNLKFAPRARAEQAIYACVNDPTKKLSSSPRRYQAIAFSRAAGMHFHSVILSGGGAHATTESKDPGAASCNNVDSGSFCDDPPPYHSGRSEESAVPHSCRNALHLHGGFSILGMFRLRAASARAALRSTRRRLRVSSIKT